MARRIGGPLLLLMMQMWHLVIGIGLALLLAALLARHAMKVHARNRAAPFLLFDEASRLLDQPEIGQAETVGSYTLSGSYGGHPVQVRVVTDTLAVRKLPSMWLMVTIPEPLPVRAIFDMVMRPAGPVTFSNFDQLAHSLPLPA